MVSIIIPCYNYGRFLAESIESVIAQNYSDWECIIVNDGSTDNTEDIALKYADEDQRFKYIYQQNAGHSAARNTALKISRGQFIQFLDADDFLEPNKLNLQVQLFQSDVENKIDVIYSDILTFLHHDSKRVLSSANFFKTAPVSGKGEVLISNMIDDNLFLPGCVLMRRKVYEQVGELKSSYGYEDWEFFSRAAFAGFSFYHDPREGTRLIARGHGNNATSKNKEMLYSKIKVREEIISVFNKLYMENKLTLSKTYIKSINQIHSSFLAQDRTTYNVYYGDIIYGIKNMFLHAFYSRKPFSAFRNGIRWTYLRLKGYKV